MMDQRTQKQLHFQKNARNGQILLYQDGEFESNNLDDQDIDELIVRMADIEKEKIRAGQINQNEISTIKSEESGATKLLRNNPSCSLRSCRNSGSVARDLNRMISNNKFIIKQKP